MVPISFSFHRSTFESKGHGLGMLPRLSAEILLKIAKLCLNLAAMANDPWEFIKNFEQKFQAHRHESRMQFLIHFRPREFHFYMMIVAELRGKFRPQAPFRAMIRKFPLGHWQETILELLARFSKKREADPTRSGIENGISFIKAACAEFPEFFADNLDDLFLARINFPGHLTTYMWQKFGQGYIEFLKLFVDANSDDTDAQCRGLSYALIVGDRQLERWAKNFIRTQLDIPRKFIEGLNVTAEMLNENLLAQGLEWRGNDVRRLYPKQVYHLVFPYRYLHGSMDHETFQKQTTLPTHFTFGGAVAATNAAGKRSRIQHFLNLDPIPQFLPVTGLHRLLIAADMDEVLLSPGDTFQEHRPDGSVIVLDDCRDQLPSGQMAFESSTAFVKSTQVLLSSQGPAWYFQRIPLHEGSNFYRLGGPPTFIGAPHYPNCKKCNKTMTFLLQMDASLPQSDGRALEWGHSGMCYVYWCDGCKVSALHWVAE